MKRSVLFLAYVCLLAISATATVSVSSPSSGAVVGSPVHYSATSSTTCWKGVASMGIYINNHLTYVVNGHSLNTSLSLGPGAYHTVVEEWDHCGGATFTTVPITVSGQSGVSVSSPSNGSTVNSPVNYAASASSTCQKGVASMGVYVDNKLIYVHGGSSLNASLQVGGGGHNTVVEEWDYCGGATYKSMNITVGGGGGNSLYSLQAGSWAGYGEYPPAYNICTSCGSGVTWYTGRGVKSPSLSGNATQYTIGGSKPYSDVLFVNKVLGQGSSIPDSGRKILPNLHNFTYDVYFWGGNLSLSQVLEFDINMYLNGMSFIWGNQCRIAGGNAWDIWDNIHNKWVPANVSCWPISNAWNHVTIQVQRTSNNQLLFHSITLNGNTAVIDRYYSPGGAPWGWYGITLNFQMDGNYKQAPYTVFLDNLTFNYW